MTKRHTSAASARLVSTTALAVSLAALSGAAAAVPGYVTEGTNTAPVLSGTGLCWRTGEWSPDRAASPCDAVARASAAPVPVVQAAPAPAPAPLAAAPAAPVIEKVTLSTDVLFDFNKADLKQGGQQRLDELAETAKGAQVDRVVIVGHADRIASEEYNQQLSERRAEAVKDYLASKGVATDRVEAQGRGESEPVTGDQCRRMGPERASNKKLVSCLQPDRRVDIEVLGQREVAGGSAPASSGAGAGSSSSAPRSGSR